MCRTPDGPATLALSRAADTAAARQTFTEAAEAARAVGDPAWLGTAALGLAGPSWQGFGTGDVDIVIEDWGHPDLEKKFFADQGDGSATNVGDLGAVGIIGLIFMGIGLFAPETIHLLGGAH